MSAWRRSAGIAGRAGGVREEVEVAFARREREHPCVAQGACVRRERQIVLYAAKPGIEGEQQGAEPLKVRGVGGVADVEIAREARAGLDHHGNAADDHEVDLGPHERSDQCGWSEVRPARHGASRRRM